MKTNNTIINSIMKNYIKYLCALLLLGLSTSTWAADETLTLAQGSITASYTTNTSSQNTSASNAIGLSWTRCLYSAGFQLEANNGEIHSTSYPSTNCVIKTITLTVSTGTAALMGSYNGTSWYPVSFTSGSAVNVENMGFRFFKITNTGSMCKFSALSVVYTTPTYYTITYNDKDGEHTVSALKGRTLTEVLSEVYSGADPTSCNTTDYPYFYGWKSSAISGTTSTPPTVLKAEKVTAAATYYAVWTDEPLEWAAASSISEGDKVVFCYVNGDTKKEMTSLYGDYFAVSNFETGESVPTGTYTFLVETGNGGTGFSFLHDGGYISHVGDKKVTLSPIKNNASSWTVSFSGTNATMTNADATSYKFQYNTGSPRFTDYSSSQSLPQIYKKQQSGTPVYLTSCCDNMVDAPTVTGTSTKNSIILSWTNVTGATGYAITCSGGTPGSVNSSGTSRSCTITGLSPNTTYTWSVVATYEDPYCGATPANGNTTTSQVYAVTYDANGGTVTTLPSAASYAVGETVTVAAKPATTVKDGYNFTGWNTSDDGTGDHYESSGSATFIMPSSAVTLYAEWTAKTYEKYVFSCVDISVASADAGKALVTSRNGINVMATNPIKVTVSGAVAGHRVTFTNSVGLKFYKKVEGTGDDAGKYKYVEAIDANSFVTPLTNQEVYVSYNPTSGGTGAVLSALPFTISCDGESQEFNTSGEYVKARNLPDAVAIVANVGGSWHGLSANITSSSTPKDQMIAVATTDGILKAYGPANSFGYKLWPVRTVNSSYDRSGYTYTTGYPAKIFGDRLRFAGKDSKGLMANNNESSNKYNINNNGTITAVTADFEHDENYEWKVTTREINGQFVYTLQSDQAYNNRHLRLWNGRWGTYLDEKGTEDLYILPLVETALVDMQPFEWGTDQVVVYYTPGATPVALTGVNLGSSAAASPTFAQIGSSDLWRVSGLTGMTSKPAQQLQVMITENGAAKQGLLQIPLIVSGNSTEAELRASLTGADATEKNKVAKNTDVVILNGGKLTTGTNSGNFKDLYIYAGGKAIITNTMSFGDMYMRGGFGYIGDERWDVPRAKIDAAIDLSGKLYYDLTMDGTKYYDLAVPYEVNLTEATDDKGDGDFNVWMKVYDGTLRANTGKGWTWYDWSGDLLLHPGTGYLIEATPRYNRSYCTVRFPMTPDLSSGEAAKDPFAVTAPGMNADGTIATGKTPNNVGWNFVANPYMCNFGSNEMSGSADDVLQVGELSENEETHKYEWDTEGAKNVRYVTIFNYNTQEYSQQAWSSTVLAPFTGFFVQIAKAGAINFATAGRQLSAPAILRATKLPSDMEIVITASGNGQSDETRLHINNELTLAYALEFPDEMTKQMNVGALNFYTISNNTNMYANGMSYADAQEWVSIGIDIPEEGLFTFSVGEVNENYIKSVLIVDKNSGLEYDLTSISPQLMLDAGIFDARFAVKIVLRDEGEIPTGIADLNAGGDTPKKFIYQDKMYIMRNGILYDATGKRVQTINKQFNDFRF